MPNQLDMIEAALEDNAMLRDQNRQLVEQIENDRCMYEQRLAAWEEAEIQSREKDRLIKDLSERVRFGRKALDELHQLRQENDLSRTREATHAARQVDAWELKVKGLEQSCHDADARAQGAEARAQEVEVEKHQLAIDNYALKDKLEKLCMAVIQRNAQDGAYQSEQAPEPNKFFVETQDMRGVKQRVCGLCGQARKTSECRLIDSIKYGSQRRKELKSETISRLRDLNKENCGPRVQTASEIIKPTLTSLASTNIGSSRAGKENNYIPGGSRRRRSIA